MTTATSSTSSKFTETHFILFLFFCADFRVYSSVSLASEFRHHLYDVLGLPVYFQTLHSLIFHADTKLMFQKCRIGIEKGIVECTL